MTEETRQQAIKKCDEKAGEFAVAAVRSLYWFIQSLRWGTAASTAYLWQMAARFGAMSVVFAVTRNDLRDGGTNDRLSRT